MADETHNETTQPAEHTSSNDGMLGGVTDKLSSAMSGSGGDQVSGDNQSYLSKGITAVQQSVFGQGQQSGEAKPPAMDQEKQKIHDAVDQAHPEQISEFMRDKYRSRTEEMNKEDGRT